MEQVAASIAFEGRPTSDQSAVWAEIATRQHRNSTRSGTGAMSDLYLQPKAELGEVERRLRCPEDGAVGVVALVGGRAHCADLFDRPETLRALWPRLVRSYALEAAEAPAKPGLDSARRLLGRPARARRTIVPSVGLGLDVRLSGGGIVGAALVHAGAVVHAALFRQRATRTGQPGISRPSRRARSYGRMHQTAGQPDVS
jgi:ARG and Rhodanese-Phosphatase-superfamily-associated Protein domain